MGAGVRLLSSCHKGSPSDKITLCNSPAWFIHSWQSSVNGARWRNMNLLNLAERLGERLRSAACASQGRQHAGAIHHQPRRGGWQWEIDRALSLKRQLPFATYGRQTAMAHPELCGVQRGGGGGGEGTWAREWHLGISIIWHPFSVFSMQTWSLLPLLEFQFPPPAYTPVS